LDFLPNPSENDPNWCSEEEDLRYESSLRSPWPSNNRAGIYPHENGTNDTYQQTCHYHKAHQRASSYSDCNASIWRPNSFPMAPSISEHITHGTITLEDSYANQLLQHNQFQNTKYNPPPLTFGTNGDNISEESSISSLERYQVFPPKEGKCLRRLGHLNVGPKLRNLGSNNHSTLGITLFDSNPSIPEDAPMANSSALDSTSNYVDSTEFRGPGNPQLSPNNAVSSIQAPIRRASLFHFQSYTSAANIDQNSTGSSHLISPISEQDEISSEMQSGGESLLSKDIEDLLTNAFSANYPAEDLELKFPGRDGDATNCDLKPLPIPSNGGRSRNKSPTSMGTNPDLVPAPPKVCFVSPKKKRVRSFEGFAIKANQVVSGTKMCAAIHGMLGRFKRHSTPEPSGQITQNNRPNTICSTLQSAKLFEPETLRSKTTSPQAILSLEESREKIETMKPVTLQLRIEEKKSECLYMPTPEPSSNDLQSSPCSFEHDSAEIQSFETVFDVELGAPVEVTNRKVPSTPRRLSDGTIYSQRKDSLSTLAAPVPKRPNDFSSILREKWDADNSTMLQPVQETPEKEDHVAAPLAPWLTPVMLTPSLRSTYVSGETPAPECPSSTSPFTSPCIQRSERSSLCSDASYAHEVGNLARFSALSPKKYEDFRATWEDRGKESMRQPHPKWSSISSSLVFQAPR
jgi:hypothetical protein